MSGKDEQPLRIQIPVEIEGRPYMIVACGACYRNMDMILQREMGNYIAFTFECSVCFKLHIKCILKEEIMRVMNSYAITED